MTTDAAAPAALSIEAETLWDTIETYASLCYDQGAADDPTAFDMAHEVGSVSQGINRTIREWDAARAATDRLIAACRELRHNTYPGAGDGWHKVDDDVWGRFRDAYDARAGVGGQ